MLSLITRSLLWQSLSGLSFAKVGASVSHDFTAFIDWLSRDFWRVTTLAALIYIGVQHFSLVSARHEAAKWEKQFNAEHAGRLADRKAYQDAQTQAAQANKAQVQKVEQQYQRITDNERQSYLSDLAKLRAQRVRPSASAPQGGTGTTDPSPDSSAAPRIDESGVCVPATSDVCEAGAEIELKLMHLQNYVSDVLSVDPNK